MSIETLDDILEDILNMIGLCGHNHTAEVGDETCYDERTCRCCQKVILETRIRRAMEIERKLGME